MSESMVGKERICPVCDEKVPADSSSCPSCNTDLTLFQVNGERVKVDDRMQMGGKANGHVEDLLKAAKTDSFQSTVASASSVEMFECPECNKMIPDDVDSCPNCGVEFAEGEVFECPLCQTLVDINVDKCPNCGAEFIDGEGAMEPESTSSKPAAPTPKPEPETVEPPKELTFAERMKAMKEEKAGEVKSTEKTSVSEPVKEMTFAERMKAMKEGKTIESSAQAPTTTEPTPAVTEPPPQVKSSTPVVQPVKKKVEPAHPATTPAQPMDKAKLKEKYKELPKLIGTVKKYLAVAKKCKVDVTKSRALINQAVAAGKNKDLESAVRLVEEGKSGIENTISTYLDERLEDLNLKVEEVKSGGQVPPGALQNIEKIKASILANDFESALLEIERTEDILKETVGEDVLDAKTELKRIMITIDDAKVLNIELGEVLALYNEAEKAVQLDDWSSAATFTKQAQENLNKVLPSHISASMKKAKTSLLEIKMMNIDISQPVEFLKSANVALKEGKYTTALHCVREFRDYLEKENYVM